MKTLQHIPDYIKAALQSKCVPESSVIAAICADMNNRGDFFETWVIAQKDALLLLYGYQHTAQTGIFFKKASLVWEEHGYEYMPLEPLSDFKVEKLAACSSLTATLDGKPCEICRFLSGKAQLVNMFVIILNKLKKGEPVTDSDYEFDQSLFCPKCGLAYPEPERKICPRCMDKASLTKRMFSITKDYSKVVALLIFIMLLSTLSSVLLPYISGQVFFDEVLNPKGRFFGQLLGFIAAMVGVRLLNLLLNMLYGIITGTIAPRMIYDLKKRIFSNMQRLSLGFFSSRQTGSLMNRVNYDAENLYWFFLDAIPYLVINAGTIFFIAIAMLTMNWQMTIISIVTVPVSFIILRACTKVFSKYFIRRFSKLSAMQAALNDALTGILVVKAFAKENQEIERFGRRSDELTQTDYKLGVSIGTAYPIVGFVMHISYFLVWGFGGWSVINGKLTFGEMMTFAAYLNMIFGPFDFLSWMISSWTDRLNSARRIFEIIDAVPEVTEKQNPVRLPNMRGDIEFDDVTFWYEPKNVILKNVSFKIEAGKTFGIVGRTGAGKTTLVNLILRLYDVKGGAIRIDGVDVRDIAFEDLRKNIAIVSQEIYLFMGSIADNIRYSNPSASMEQVIEAAKIASAHDFIMKLPDGYDTRIGIGGADLSGGERQRISIARAILHDPKILILDEASASMDTETERRIQNSLSALSKGRTTIMIAHRLSTLRDADHLLVIDDGKVAESGTHKEIISKKGIYYNLYKIQSEALKNIGVGE